MCDVCIDMCIDVCARMPWAYILVRNVARPKPLKRCRGRCPILAYACTHVCAHVYTHVRAHVGTRVNAHVCTHVYTLVYTHVRAHTDPRMCLYKCMYTCVYTYLHTYPPHMSMTRAEGRASSKIDIDGGTVKSTLTVEQ